MLLRSLCLIVLTDAAILSERAWGVVLEMERMQKNRRETVSGCSLTHVNTDLAPSYLWDACSKPITKP